MPSARAWSVPHNSPSSRLSSPFKTGWTPPLEHFDLAVWLNTAGPRSPSSCLSSPLENDWAPSSFRFPSLFRSAPTDHGNHPVENGQTFSGAATQSRGLMWNRFLDSHSCHGHRTRTPVRILIDGPCEGPDLLPLQWLLTTFLTDSIWSVLSSSSDRSGCAA